MRTASLGIALLLLAGCGSGDVVAESSPLDASTEPALDGAARTDAGDDRASDAAPDATPGTAPDASEDAPSDAAREDVDDDALDAAPDAPTGPIDAAATDATDDDAGTDAADPPPDAASGTVTVRVASGDDAVASYLIETSPPAWNIFSGDSIPLGRHTDSAHVSYYAALRFAGVKIPRGARIASARLRFYPLANVEKAQLWLNVYAEKSGDSAPFDPTNYLTGRPDQRTRTTSFVDRWLVRCDSSCKDATNPDCPQRKLDCWKQDTRYEVPKNLAPMIEEVVGQAAWASGHALTLLLVNAATDADGAAAQGRRHITGFDTARGAEYAPELAITLATP